MVLQRVGINKLMYKILFTFMLVFSLSIGVVANSVPVMATSTVSEAQASKNLTQKVKIALENNSYTLEGGGNIAGKSLFTGSDSKGYELNEGVFSSLSKDAQAQVISDIVKASDNAIGKNGVTQSTVQNWYKQLQTKEGVGSKFMTEILKGTKPDFVTANAIYAPFSGVV